MAAATGVPLSTRYTVNIPVRCVAPAIVLAGCLLYRGPGWVGGGAAVAPCPPSAHPWSYGREGAGNGNGWDVPCHVFQAGFASARPAAPLQPPTHATRTALLASVRFMVVCPQMCVRPGCSRRRDGKQFDTEVYPAGLQGVCVRADHEEARDGVLCSTRLGPTPWLLAEGVQCA